MDFAIINLKYALIVLKHLYWSNLTWYEKNNIRRLNYLFRDPYGRSVFNPFNKGIQRNLEEMLINMFDINIYNDYKNYNCQDLSELIEEDKTKKEEEEFNSFDDMASFRLMIRLVEHFDPLITSKDNIYKFVDGKEIINWNRCLLFTIFDIINSPMKDAMIKQAKYYIEQNEASIRERDKKINNDKNQEINKDEKIDEKDNSEDNKDDKENEQKNLINTNSEDNN